MSREIVFKNPKVGDYVAVTTEEVTVMVSQIKKVTEHQIVLGGDNRYWRDAGKRVHESTRGSFAHPSTKVEHDTWLNRAEGYRKKREREESERLAEAEKEESKITAAIASELEFGRDELKKLPIWRLRMAYHALLAEDKREEEIVAKACGNVPAFS